MADNMNKLDLAGRRTISGTETHASFLVIRLKAHPGRRRVSATCFVNENAIGSVSAADNYVNDVISSTSQTMTIPVPARGQWKVDWLEENSSEEEVQIWSVKA